LREACNHPDTELAWYEFHNFIEIAKGLSMENFPYTHYFDLHGQSISPKVMVGNLIRRVDFDTDPMTQLQHRLAHSSLRSLAHAAVTGNLTADRHLVLLEPLIGSTSLAHMMHKEGYHSEPLWFSPYHWGMKTNVGKFVTTYECDWIFSLQGQAVFIMEATMCGGMDRSG
jgi:hypothetical protein